MKIDNKRLNEVYAKLTYPMATVYAVIEAWEAAKLTHQPDGCRELAIHAMYHAYNTAPQGVESITGTREIWLRFQAEHYVDKILEAIKPYLQSPKRESQPDELSRLRNAILSEVKSEEDVAASNKRQAEKYKNEKNFSDMHHALDLARSQEYQSSIYKTFLALLEEAEGSTPEREVSELETLDKTGTIKAIEAIQREYLERAKPYQERLAAFMDSEYPKPIITDHGVFQYRGPLPPAPEVKCSKCSRVGYHDDGCMNDTTDVEVTGMSKSKRCKICGRKEGDDWYACFRATEPCQDSKSPWYRVDINDSNGD